MTVPSVVADLTARRTQENDMNDTAQIAAIDWESVAVGDPDPSQGLFDYEQCGTEIVAASGEFDGGTFWCSREDGHRGQRHVATDDTTVLAASPVLPSGGQS